MLTELTSIGGWPAIPAAIARATYQLTGILRLQSPRATSQIPEAFDQALEASPTAKKIVDETLPSNTLMKNWATSEGR